MHWHTNFGVVWVDRIPGTLVRTESVMCCVYGRFVSVLHVLVLVRLACMPLGIVGPPLPV